MASLDLHPASLTFPIAALATALVDEGEADARAAAPADSYGCYYGDVGYPSPTGGYDYCANQDILYELVPSNADAIPIDGVLVLQAVTNSTWDPAATVAKVEVNVTLDGEPVPGALEWPGVYQTLVWRPAASLTPGATYDFTASIKNPVLPAGCVEPEIPVAFAFTAADGPAVALTPSTLSGAVTLSEIPRVDLESLACCPGVSPTLNPGMCGGSFLDFDDAQCTPIVADGSLYADLTGSPAAAGPTAAQVHYGLTIDGSMTVSAEPAPHFTFGFPKPFCASVTATSFIDGTTVVGPMACFGTEFAAKLGEHTIDPPDSFTCSLRQCEPTAEGWDLDACTPLDPDHPNEPADDDTKGCSCSAADAEHAALLLALPVLLAARRRRPAAASRVSSR